ncbi:hypothetical protein BDN67DRAFT_992646 [Paxillus ammoniavirescens]|nr:hypothetical protein BDN67DRAFT_992646 [Paxillus ammoniavirescens]
MVQRKISLGMERQDKGEGLYICWYIPVTSKKRKAYRLYRNGSDEEDDIAHAWMVFVSNDGRRHFTLPTSPTKLSPTPRFTLMGNWTTTLDADFHFDDEGSYQNGISDAYTVTAKQTAKRYHNSGYWDEYLMEEIQLESRGDAGLLPDCFRMEVICQACCVETHKHLPLHNIKKWNGCFFEKVYLKELGLTMLLGHSDCYSTEHGHVNFLIIDVNGIHLQLLHAGWYPSTIHNLCTACTRNALEHFLHLMWSSKVSAFKYYCTLEHLTDSTGIHLPKFRSSNAADLGLHTGLAYFVPNQPYQEHILKYASQNDISTCSGFKSLAHAETKFSTGLRLTGVGLCLCARHEYCNMDYIFFSSLVPLLLLSVIISYNIACQWKVNLLSRMKELPRNLQLPLTVATTCFIFSVPKFHAPAHAAGCATPHSLDLMPGVGRTDGEGVEWNWAEMNRVANSTKEMGPGARHDTLDDQIRHHNWKKYVGLVDQMIQAWELDKSKSNLYIPVQSSLTEAEVRAQLAGEDHATAASGGLSCHGTSPSSFISLGLVLEESQSEVKNKPASTATQHAELQLHRVTLHYQIYRFCTVQAIYMVGINTLLSWLPDPSGLEPEDVVLMLPSTIEQLSCSEICTCDIEVIEDKLWESQCQDTLNKLRNYLHTKTHFIKYCNTNVRGQQANIRANSLINRLSEKVDSAAKKGNDPWKNKLWVLDTSGDIANPNDSIGADRHRKSQRQLQELQHGLGEGRRTTSWIWKTMGTLGEHKGLNEVLHIEWAKSRARAARWSEEVMLLKEEMWWVHEYLEWKARWWEERHEVLTGIAVYADRQAALQQALWDHFTKLWEDRLEPPTNLSKNPQNSLTDEGLPGLDGEEDLGNTSDDLCGYEGWEEDREEADNNNNNEGDF